MYKCPGLHIVGTMKILQYPELTAYISQQFMGKQNLIIGNHVTNCVIYYVPACASQTFDQILYVPIVIYANWIRANWIYENGNY